MFEKFKNLDTAEKKRYCVYGIIVLLALILAIGSLVTIYSGGNGNTADLGGDEVVMPDSGNNGEPDIVPEQPTEEDKAEAETKEPVVPEKETETETTPVPETKPDPEVLPEKPEPEQKPADVPTHKHTFTDEVIEPTCTDLGYTRHTCSCGETYTDEYKDALGHDYQEAEIVDATCEKDGYVLYRCSHCGLEKKETLKAIGHKWKHVEEQGENEHIFNVYDECENCGATKNHLLIVDAVGSEDCWG